MKHSTLARLPNEDLTKCLPVTRKNQDGKLWFLLRTVVERPAEARQRVVGRNTARAETGTHEQNGHGCLFHEPAPARVDLSRRKRRDDRRALLRKDRLGPR